jgi:hypothetical protein
MRLNLQATGWVQPRGCRSAPTPQGAEKSRSSAHVFATVPPLICGGLIIFLFWSFLSACAAVCG